MVKVRFDIVVAAFLIFFLVIVGNSVVNINKGYYEESEMRGCVGCPPSENTIAAMTLEHIAVAEEMGYGFSIVADPDKVKATNYYSNLKGDRTVEKKSRFSIWHNRALGGSFYDRVYIVELQDGNVVPVLMLDGVLDLSGDMVIFPVGEVEFPQKELDYLTALDKKYDLSESVEGQWYVNASGRDLTLFTDYRDKAESVKTTSEILIGVGIFLYAILSTVYFVKRRKAMVNE